jgi:O-antigen/teichoic acid export membrane protein
MKSRQLKKNLLANYIGQFYLIIISIIMVPFYLKYMGSEAYGLIGFFTLIQSWMMLLDAGFSPTLLREVARVKSSKSTEKLKEFKYLFHSMETLFFLAASTTALLLFSFSDFLSIHWLKVESLPLEKVSYVISLIGIMVGIRFTTTLYKSAIAGAEELIWLNKVNILIATIRYIGVLFVLHFISSDFQHFFEYQLLVAIAELLTFAIFFYKTMEIGHYIFYFSLNALRPILSFSMGIAYSSIVWIIITQLDKLLLSGILSLKEYGYFSILTVIANGIIQIASPITKALLPRMSALYAENNLKEMIVIYRQTSQIFAILLFSVTAIITLFSYQLLFAWTGDKEAAEWGKNVLIWYTLGNALLTFSGFAFYIQFVYGNLKMHLRFYTFLLIFLSPLIAYTTYTYGAEGMAKLWFFFSLSTFIIWVAWIHHIFIPKQHIPWLTKDIMPIFFSTITYIFLLKTFDLITKEGVGMITLFSLGLGLLITNIFASSLGREFIFKRG